MRFVLLCHRGMCLTGSRAKHSLGDVIYAWREGEEPAFCANELRQFWIQTVEAAAGDAPARPSALADEATIEAYQVAYGAWKMLIDEQLAMLCQRDEDGMPGIRCSTDGITAGSIDALKAVGEIPRRSVKGQLVTTAEGR